MTASFKNFVLLVFFETLFRGDTSCTYDPSLWSYVWTCNLQQNDDHPDVYSTLIQKPTVPGQQLFVADQTYTIIAMENYPPYDSDPLSEPDREPGTRSNLCIEHGQNMTFFVHPRVENDQENEDSAETSTIPPIREDEFFPTMEPRSTQRVEYFEDDEDIEIKDLAQLVPMLLILGLVAILILVILLIYICTVKKRRPSTNSDRHLHKRIEASADIRDASIEWPTALHPNRQPLLNARASISTTGWEFRSGGNTIFAVKPEVPTYIKQVPELVVERQDTHVLHNCSSCNDTGIEDFIEEDKVFHDSHGMGTTAHV